MRTEGPCSWCSARRPVLLRRFPFGFLLLFLPLLLRPAGILAQDGAIAGTVKDAATSTGLATVEVNVLSADGAVVAGDFSGQNGAFRVTGIPPGTYTLRLTIPGWQTLSEPGVVVTAGQVTSLRLVLEEQMFSMNPITATVSRGVEEKLLDAPASVHVVSQATIQKHQSLSTTDYVDDVAGVDVITTGLQGNYFVTRGFNNIFSGAVMFLTDYRIVQVPSLRANIAHLNPTVPADIGRIEVVLGPASSIYGPNTANGVVHLITTSPIDDPGLVFSVAGGARRQGGSGLGPMEVDKNTEGVFQGQGRVSIKASDKFGIKVSGQFLGGTDFIFIDPAEVEAQALAQACLAGVQEACFAFQPGTTDEQLMNVGQRDDDLNNWSLDVRADWRPTEETDVVFSYGHTTSNTSIDLTGIGAGQIDGWKYDYYQARVNHKDLFAQVYFNKSNAGDTFLLRTGQPIVDLSSLFGAQLQNTSFLGERQSFTYGADYLFTNPRTEGTINGVFEDEDQITQVGAFVQSQTQLSRQLDLILALRGDYHSVLDDFVWSPRVAFVYKPEPNHALRATYNRAFSTPTTNNLFLDLLARVVPLGGPFFYPINTQGVRDGFAFSRTDGRADMKSPFAPLIGQSPAAFMPTTTENLWALAVGSVGASDPVLGALLGSLPVPNESQVGIVSAFLDPGSGTFIVDPRGVDGITDIPAIDNQITNTIEAGYKGLIAEKFLIGFDFYYTLIEDFIGPLRIETPNAFLSGGDIAGYLAGFGIPPELAGQIAQGMAVIPLGVITPEGVSTQNAPLLLTYRNFGSVDLFGADLSAQYQATPEWFFGLTASYVSDDTFDADGLDVALNATRFKTSIGLGYDRLGSGFMADAKFRYIDGFPANSGVYVGDVDSYSPVDVTLGWEFANKGVMLQLDVTNIFDESYQSFPGTPILGRVALFRIVYNTP